MVRGVEYSGMILLVALIALTYFCSCFQDARAPGAEVAEAQQATDTRAAERAAGPLRAEPPQRPAMAPRPRPLHQAVAAAALGAALAAAVAGGVVALTSRVGPRAFVAAAAVAAAALVLAR